MNEVPRSRVKRDQPPAAHAPGPSALSFVQHIRLQQTMKFPPGTWRKRRRCRVGKCREAPCADANKSEQAYPQNWTSNFVHGRINVRTYGGLSLPFWGGIP